MAKTTKKTTAKIDSKPQAAAPVLGEKGGTDTVTKKVAARAAQPATAKKKVAKKVTANKAAVGKKVAAKKTVSKKTAVRKKAVPKAARTVTVQERHDLIAQAAYLRSESQGFLGNEADDWLAAEAEVDARLKKAGVKVTG